MKGWLVGLALVIVLGAAGVGLWVTWDSTQTSRRPALDGDERPPRHDHDRGLPGDDDHRARPPPCEPGDEPVAGDPDDDWATTVIDTGHRLPAEFAPADLVEVDAGRVRQPATRSGPFVIADLAALRAGRRGQRHADRRHLRLPQLRLPGRTCSPTGSTEVGRGRGGAAHRPARATASTSSARPSTCSTPASATSRPPSPTPRPASGWPPTPTSTASCSATPTAPATAPATSSSPGTCATSAATSPPRSTSPASPPGSGCSPTRADDAG